MQPAPVRLRDSECAGLLSTQLGTESSISQHRTAPTFGAYMHISKSGRGSEGIIEVYENEILMLRNYITPNGLLVLQVKFILQFLGSKYIGEM
jgi:hypothetical protein